MGLTVFSSPLYEISIFNHSGTRVMVLDGWEYLQYSQRINAPWNHQIRIKMSYLDDRVSFLRNTLVRDYMIEVQRTDPITGDRARVYEGFHRTLVDQATKVGDLIFTFYGTGYTHLLTRRIVLPPPLQENNEKTDIASTAMYAFVDECMINPLDSTRIFTGFENVEDTVVGNVATYSARYTNLMTVLERLSEQGDVDFGVYRGDEPGTFIFEVRSLWGQNKTHGSGATPPVIFDMFTNNMEIPILSRQGDGEVTHVYVGGHGDGINRVIEEFASANETVSPWNRIEAFVEARRETTSDGRANAAAEYLWHNRFEESLNFNIRQTEGTRWIRDWGLGDLVTARYFSIQVDKKIREVDVVVSAGEGDESPTEVVNAELEDA